MTCVPSSLCESITIAPYLKSDFNSIKALFIEINRELAVNSLQTEFEAYIELALKQEIEQLPEFYHTRHGEFWTVKSGTDLIGMFGLEVLDGNTAELRRMYVKKTHRRQGIAALMLDHFERQALERGLSMIVLSTSEFQLAAIAFYKASGYELTHETVIKEQSTKTVGSGSRRFYFEKTL